MNASNHSIWKRILIRFLSIFNLELGEDELVDESDHLVSVYGEVINPRYTTKKAAISTVPSEMIIVPKAIVIQESYALKKHVREYEHINPGRSRKTSSVNFHEDDGGEG